MMNHYPVSELAEAIGMVYELHFCGETTLNSGVHAFDIADKQFQGVVLGRLKYIQAQCVRVELVACARYIDSVLAEFTLGATPPQLMHEATTLKRLIKNELWERRFLYVPVEKAKMWFAIDAEWGTIIAKFKQSEDDCREAVYCFAVGRNTACVFHLMRAVEHGMRSLAAKLRIKNVPSGKSTRPVAWSEWQAVIDAIEGKARQTVGAMKAGPARDVKQRFYGDAIASIREFKDAYRNHVMHTRKNYQEKEAQLLLAHVRTFMDKLATP
jgi:hypothetical protein